MMRQSDNAIGALIMTGSMLAFVVNDGLMKYLFTDMSLYQAVLLRGIFCIPVIAALAWHKRQLFIRLSRRDWRIVIIRSAAEVLATIGFLSALAHMPLANVTAILQALPLTVTMAAALFLGERVGWRRWSAIGVGFIGILFIVRPGMDGFSIHSLSALFAVACVTVRDISTRRLSSDTPSLFVALVTATAIAGMAAVMMPTVTWVAPDTGMWMVTLGAGTAIIFGYLLSVMAMRVGDISFTAPFRYTAMVWALLIGVLVFGEWPDHATLFGTAIIVATGLYSFRREQVHKADSR